MTDNPEPEANSEPEKENRAPQNTARDESLEPSRKQPTESQPLPSRLFAIFAGLDEPTAEEKQFLSDNPKYQEIGEQIAKALKDLQANPQKKGGNSGRFR